MNSAIYIGMGPLPFLRQHALPVLLIVGAAAFWALDMVARYQQIMGMPGWVWQVSAGGLVLIAVCVFFYQVHRTLESAKFPLPSKSLGHFLEVDPPRDEQLYEEAHEKLMHFVVGPLFEACFAREQVHGEIISALCRNGPIAALARLGALHSQDAHEYRLGREGLDGLTDSPPEFIPFKQMAESVAHIENGYRTFLQQADRLAQTGYIDQSAETRIAKLWEEWRTAHNEMVAAYEVIRRDPKMGALFRPARESRWGGAVPAALHSIPIPLMLREVEDSPR